MESNDKFQEAFAHIESGSKLIRKIIKAIKKPVQKEGVAQIKDSVDILEKQLKMMKKDEALAVQYIDRCCFNTIQGLFQILHFYIVSTDKNDLIDEAVEWLRAHENCYSIADRMQAAANKRADFSGGKK